MWILVKSINEKENFNEFKDACKSLIDYVKIRMDEGMTWMELETMIWIEQETKVGEPMRVPMMFYDVRDFCFGAGWLDETGKWIG